MAIEVKMEIDLVAPRRSCNKLRINYDKTGGWIKYNAIYNIQANEIRTVIKTHKCKNDRQKAFKEITFKFEKEKRRLKLKLFNLPGQHYQNEPDHVRGKK